MFNQEQLENLEKEKQNVAQCQEVNQELSVRLSSVESELEQLRTERERLTEELQQSTSTEDSTSQALEMERSRVIELQQEIDRLSANTDASDAVAEVEMFLLVLFNYLLYLVPHVIIIICTNVKSSVFMSVNLFVTNTLGSRTIYPDM